MTKKSVDKVIQAYAMMRSLNRGEFAELTRMLREEIATGAPTPRPEFVVARQVGLVASLN